MKLEDFTKEELASYIRENTAHSEQCLCRQMITRRAVSLEVQKEAARARYEALMKPYKGWNMMHIPSQICLEAIHAMKEYQDLQAAHGRCLRAWADILNQ